MKAFLQALLMMIAVSTTASAFELKTGDIILQSNACYLCGMIEAEENSPYSHIGILIQNGSTLSVLESWGSVRISTLDEFLSRRKKETKDLILRVNTKLKSLPLNSNVLLTHFKENFEGLSYDSNFLWNNQDIHGEKLYCSEFVAKFLQPFLTQAIPTKPMHFNVNRDFWLKFFHGNPPDGQPGLSPGDFERSPLFRKIGFI